MSTLAPFEPTEAEILAYMAAHHVSYAEARFALIKAHLQQNTSH